MSSLGEHAFLLYRIECSFCYNTIDSTGHGLDSVLESGWYVLEGRNGGPDRVSCPRCKATYPEGESDE